MHGKDRETILNLPSDMFDLATWDDFRAWETGWKFGERLRWRMRFWMPYLRMLWRGIP